MGLPLSESILKILCTGGTKQTSCIIQEEFKEPIKKATSSEEGEFVIKRRKHSTDDEDAFYSDPLDLEDLKILDPFRFVE